MMTVDSLQQQYQTQWPNLSDRQRAAFRGNVTWLLGRTHDPHEYQRLDELRTSIQPAGTSRPARSNSTPTSPRRFHLNATRLELHRTRLTLAESPAIGTQVYQPSTAAAIATQLIGGQAQEHLLLLLLDIRHTVTGVHTVHIGTTHKCVVEPGDILRVALVALITRAVENPKYGNDYRGVWHDILRMNRMTGRFITAPGTMPSIRLFRVIITGAGRRRYHTLKLVRHEDEFGSTCATYMLPDED